MGQLPLVNHHHLCRLYSTGWASPVPSYEEDTGPLYFWQEAAVVDDGPRVLRYYNAAADTRISICVFQGSSNGIAKGSIDTGHIHGVIMG